jgi:hypothetical protein
MPIEIHGCQRGQHWPREMEVKVVKLFGGVVSLALLVICGLSFRLLGQRSEIIQSEVVLQLHRRPLQVACALADSGKNCSRTNVTVHRGGLNDSTSVRLQSDSEDPEIAGSLSPISLFKGSSSSSSSLWIESLNQTIGTSPHQHTLSGSSSSSAYQSTDSPHANSSSSSKTMITVATLVPKTKVTVSSSESTAPLTTTTVPPGTGTGSSGGYVLAENYYEQQTMGLRNMMQLQCWAQSLRMRVVKPVMHDSFLRTPLDTAQQASYLKFEDSFDEVEWSQQADKLGYAPLVSWAEFLARAPRDVVLVQFEHPSVSMLKSRQRSGQGILHTPDFDRYTTGCSGKWPTARDTYFLKSNGFRIVRTVCFNFYYGDQLSLGEFNRHILGDLSPISLTVIMETWRGISSAQRVLLKDVCQNTALVQEHIPLSPRLVQQAEQYIHKYLGGSQRYLAVMGRLEISQLTVHKKVPVVPLCLEETLVQWRQFKTSLKLDQTFLSIDIGRFGSKKYRSGLQPEIEISFRKFFQTLFGVSATVKEWEKGFELVAGTRDAGYIGLLQKALVTRAQCVLFVGGGAFQRHALYLYKQLHPELKDQCYRIVKQCTRSNKLS